MVLQPFVEKLLYAFWTINAYYSVNQLLTLFFVYAFIGWLLEIGYRSMRNRRLVNPGVLKGPIVPIYGVGGVLITITYVLIQSEPLVVRLAIYGVSITILELITGEALLLIFKRRYWDYSADPLNLHGHICLPFSAAWTLLAFVVEKSTFPFTVWLFTWIGNEVLVSVNRLAFSLLMVDLVFILIGPTRIGVVFSSMIELRLKLVRMFSFWWLLQLEPFLRRDWSRQKIEKQRAKLGLIVNQAFTRKNKLRNKSRKNTQARHE